MPSDGSRRTAGGERRPGGRRVVVALALAATAGLVGLLVLEVAVRVALPQDLAFFDGSAVKRLSARRGLKWELVPGGRAERYIGVPVSINRFGLREREVAVPKPPGTIRILGVGDSVTFGYGVAVEQTYLRVLEERLNAAAPAGVRYETVNAGVEECGLDAYYEHIRTLGPRLEPDLVLVGVVLNDILRYGDLDRPLPAVAAEPGIPRRIHGWFLRRSHLYMAGWLAARSISYRLGLLDIRDVFGAPMRALDRPSETLEPSWASSFEVLERMIALTRARRLPLVLVLFPLEVQLDAEALERYRRDYGVTLPPGALDAEPQRRLVEFARSHDVPVVDLLPALRAAGGRDLYLRLGPIRYDPVHPSPRGHRIIGEAIHLALLEQRILRPRR